MARSPIVLGAGAGGALLAIAVSTVAPQITQFEGTRNVPYHDIAGVLTVCTGHTGPDVTVRKVYTNTQCDELTDRDITKAAAGVLKVSPQLQYHPMQLAAAISFSYNVGVGTYAKSSVASNFNTGEFKTACSALLKYTYSDNKFSQGLANRRQVEYGICMSTLTAEGVTNVVNAPSTSG